jgi:hypothetical protein
MHEEMLRTPPSGNANLDFLAQMIPHHEGAVEMARLYLVSGNDPLLRRLAEEIIAGQQAEITAMKARLEILKRGPDPSPGDFPSLGGTRGPRIPEMLRRCAAPDQVRNPTACNGLAGYDDDVIAAEPLFVPSGRLVLRDTVSAASFAI